MNETVPSYLGRLAQANGLHHKDLQAHLTGNAQRKVTAEQLAAVTGHPARNLRYAMLELCTPADLADMHLAGRSRPRPAVWGLGWPRNETRYACDHCSARRRVSRSRHGRAQVWTTPDDIVCLQHKRWLGTLQQDTQPQLNALPEILHANRRHRRLARLYGGQRAKITIAASASICRDRTEWLGRPFHDRLRHFQDRGYETRTRESPAADASAYPEIVALARIIASSCCRQTTAGSLHDPEPFDYNLLVELRAAIRASRRHRDGRPVKIQEPDAWFRSARMFLTTALDHLQES